MTAGADTVAALLTPMGPGAIAVVGLRGPGAMSIIAAFARRGTQPLEASDLADGRPRLCRIFDEERPLDDAVVVCPQSGASGARPPALVIELHVHGGVRIAQRLLMLLERRGATVVSSEEFAWGAGGCNGESEIDRQAFCALLRADSRRLTWWLLNQRMRLPPFLACRGEWTPAQREGFERRTRVALRLLGGLRVAIVGPPNAGKSTLANRLIGRERLLVSDVPGTTRDWVDETALVGGWPVTLVDTAGLRETQCDIERESIRRGSERARQADLVLIVVDATMGAASRRQDIERASHSLPGELRRIVVVNKCDLVKSADAAQSASLLVSAKAGMGVDALESAIVDALGLGVLGDDLPTGFSPEHLLDPESGAAGRGR
jgi:tRNA modification GTPase